MATASTKLERGSHGPLGVVLARDRRTPDGHHRVADELLQRAAVAFDDGAGRIEVTRLQVAHVLEVAALERL